MSSKEPPKKHVEQRFSFLDGRKVKVVVKEVQKQTNACTTCKEKKRKCNGESPCSFCIEKKQTCVYEKQKKRGPQKRRKPDESPTEINSLSTASFENELLDQVEAHNYYDSLCMEFLNVTAPIHNWHQLMKPLTPSQKIQVYSGLAYSARVHGDTAQAKVYFSQARLLSGSVYDSADPDTVSAMMLMSQYNKLVLDMKLCAHYGTLATSLAKISNCLYAPDKLGTYCQVLKVMSDEDRPIKEKSMAIKKISRNLITSSQVEDEAKCYAYLLHFSAPLMDAFGMDVLTPNSLSLSEMFQVMDNIFISEEARNQILSSMDIASQGIDGNVMLRSTTKEVGRIPVILRYVNEVFAPVYRALIEWRSGHVTQALLSGATALEALDKIYDTELFGILAEYQHVCVLGCLAKFFLEQGCQPLASKMCKHIKAICRIMSPEYDFVADMTDKLMQLSLSDTDSPTLSSSSSPNSPTIANTASPIFFSSPSLVTFPSALPSTLSTLPSNFYSDSQHISENTFSSSVTPTTNFSSPVFTTLSPSPSNFPPSPTHFSITQNISENNTTFSTFSSQFEAPYNTFSMENTSTQTQYNYALQNINSATNLNNLLSAQNIEPLSDLSSEKILDTILSNSENVQTLQSNLSHYVS